jgi:hypothetical protein
MTDMIVRALNAMSFTCGVVLAVTAGVLLLAAFAVSIAEVLQEEEGKSP